MCCKGDELFFSESCQHEIFSSLEFAGQHFDPVALHQQADETQSAYYRTGRPGADEFRQRVVDRVGDQYDDKGIYPLYRADALVIEGGAAAEVDGLIAKGSQVNGDNTVDTDVIEEASRLYNQYLPGDEAIETGDDKDGGADGIVQHEFASDKGGDTDIGCHQSVEKAAMPGKEELAIVHDKDPCQKEGREKENDVHALVRQIMFVVEYKAIEHEQGRQADNILRPLVTEHELYLQSNELARETQLLEPGIFT